VREKKKRGRKKKGKSLWRGRGGGKKITSFPFPGKLFMFPCVALLSESIKIKNKKKERKMERTVHACRREGKEKL